MRRGPSEATAAGPRVVSLHLKPTAKGMAKLRHRGKLAVKVALAFDPAGAAAIQHASASVLFKMAGGRRP